MTSDGTIFADAGRRVYQALTGSAKGVAVAVAEGDLPHGNRASHGSLLADDGRRVYQTHAGAAAGVAVAVPEGGLPGDSGASVAFELQAHWKGASILRL